MEKVCFLVYQTIVLAMNLYDFLKCSILFSTPIDPNKHHKVLEWKKLKQL